MQGTPSPNEVNVAVMPSQVYSEASFPGPRDHLGLNLTSAFVTTSCCSATSGE